MRTNFGPLRVILPGCRLAAVLYAMLSPRIDPCFVAHNTAQNQPHSIWVDIVRRNCGQSLRRFRGEIALCVRIFGKRAKIGVLSVKFRTLAAGTAYCGV